MLTLRPTVLALLFALGACAATAPQATSAPSPSAASAADEYRPTLVAVDSGVVHALGARLATDRVERLYCVTRWTERPQRDYLLVSVFAVREEPLAATATHLAITAEACRDSARAPLPTIHSHPIGACQASPNDRRTFAARHARFDGIVCGPQQFVWSLSEEINAIEFAFLVRALPSQQPPSP